MKLEAIIYFTGNDSDHLPETITHNGVLLKNFRKNEDYGEGVWKVDIYVGDDDFEGLEDSEIKAKIFQTIRDYTENTTYLIEIERMTITKKDGERTFFKSGGNFQPEIFKNGGNITADISFFKNLNLSKLPTGLKISVTDIINIAEGNFENIDFEKTAIKKELDAIPDDITAKDVNNALKEVITLYEKEIKSNYPEAIKDKKETAKTSKKEQLKTKIKGLKTALKFAKGDKKQEIETKIKGLETALKFVK